MKAVPAVAAPHLAYGRHNRWGFADGEADVVRFASVF